MPCRLIQHATQVLKQFVWPTNMQFWIYKSLGHNLFGYIYKLIFIKSLNLTRQYAI